MHGTDRIPIYTGSLAPKSQQMCGEYADGCLLTNMIPEVPEAVMENLEVGFAAPATARALRTLTSPAPLRSCSTTTSSGRARRCDSNWRYVGGFGTKKKLLQRLSEPLRLGGRLRKDPRPFPRGHARQAIDAVPNEMIDALYLVGPKERIQERFQAWKRSPIGTFMVGGRDRVIRLLAECM